MHRTKLKIKQLITLTLCGFILFGGMVSQIVLADETLSVEERRKLAKFPQFTFSGLSSGKYQDAIELYLADAFPLRSTYRKLKAAAVLQLFGKGDLNGLYFSEGHLSKIESELDEKQVSYAIKRMAQIREKYLKDMRVFYAIIPDKHFFLGEAGGYPTMDYELLQNLLREGLEDFEGIDLFETLQIKDYYTTDPHIKQTALGTLISQLALAMGFNAKPIDQYTQMTYGDFYGAYAGQIGLSSAPDRLDYLIDETLTTARVYDLEKDAWLEVYRNEADLSMDGYALFMGGASAIQILENPNAGSGKELILFRDSFGSAVAPLLLSGYDKITLIDLRYVSGEILDKYVTFDDQDVLFLYSTSVINSGGSLFR